LVKREEAAEIARTHGHPQTASDLAGPPPGVEQLIALASLGIGAARIRGAELGIPWNALRGACFSVIDWEVTLAEQRARAGDLPRSENFDAMVELVLSLVESKAAGEGLPVLPRSSSMEVYRGGEEVVGQIVGRIRELADEALATARAAMRAVMEAGDTVEALAWFARDRRTESIALMAKAEDVTKRLIAGEPEALDEFMDGPIAAVCALYAKRPRISGKDD
jgi:hypothetical protein